MNCHITIHNGNSPISIRGKWEELKQFLPLYLESPPDSLCIRDNTRRIEISATPETPDSAKVGIDLAKQYLTALSDQTTGKTICIEKFELSKIIRELERAGKSV